MNLPLIDDALFIDNSSLEKFTTCPRSAQYYIIDKIEGANERTAPAFGGKIHKILEARYKDHVNFMPQEPGRKGTTEIMQEVAAVEFKDWTPPDDDFRTYATALQFIDLYNTTYPVEAFDIYKLPDGKPAIEMPFAVPLGEIELHDGKNIKIIWTGRIDMVYQRESRLYVMDHKTTSVMGPSYFKEFELSSQVHGYVWATQQLTGQRIDGFVVNALAMRKPTKTGKAFELLRHIVPIDQSLVEEWKSDTLTIISDFVNMAERSHFPKHTKWCVGKYGVCEYATVCGLPPTQRDSILYSPAYRPVTWSPLNT